MTPILVICSDNPIMPPSRQVWTTCKCGKEIVHDRAMEARIAENHPGEAVEYACISCNADKLLDPRKLRELLAATRANMSPDLRERLARVPDERVIRYIGRLVPQ